MYSLMGYGPDGKCLGRVGVHPRTGKFGFVRFRKDADKITKEQADILAITLTNTSENTFRAVKA